MKLMALYTILVAIGEAGAIGLGEIVEKTYPSASLFAFLAFFFIVLWLAWWIAVRLTEPKTS